MVLRLSSFAADVNAALTKPGPIGGTTPNTAAFTTATTSTASIGTASTLAATTAFVAATMTATSVVTTGGATTLTPAQTGTAGFVVTGALTANAVLTIPATGMWDVVNRTTGAFTVQITNGSGTAVTVAQGAGTGVLSGASGVSVLINDYAAAGFAPSASPALTGTPTAPTAPPATSTLQLATTSFVSSAISTAVPSGGGIPLDSAQSYGKQAAAAIKQISVAASATQNLLTASGVGVLTKIFIVIQGDSNARNASTLNVYVDGEATPSVSITMNLLFNSPYAPTFKSRFIGTENSASNGNNYSGYLYIRAPFKTSIRVDLVNGSTASIVLWSILNYAIGGSYRWGSYGKLRNATLGAGATLQSVAALAEQNLLSYTGGPGVIHGLNFLVNSGGGNFFALEGIFQVYVDGEATASSLSSGTEDFFGGSFYFQGGTYATDYVGCTQINSTGYAVVCYRFFVEDPIVFNSSVRFTWTNGSNFTASQPTPKNVQSATATILTNVWFYTAS